MGFDIVACDKHDNEIAALRTNMGAFRMLIEQGYPWFDLIDASECYGGISGTGASKIIRLRDLQHALYILRTHDTRGRLGSVNPLASDVFGPALRKEHELHGKDMLKQMIHDNLGDKVWNLVKDDADHSMDKLLNSEPSNEKLDMFSALKPDLEAFMDSCITWCKENGEPGIEITFA